MDNENICIGMFYFYLQFSNLTRPFLAGFNNCKTGYKITLKILQQQKFIVVEIYIIRNLKKTVVNIFGYWNLSPTP
jgi:hypothetical protein